MEQLIAESSGKEGKGVLPVVHEPKLLTKRAPLDRMMILFNEGRAMKSAHDIGGEFFRWEFATAILCACLGVNAFDQPDVQAAKNRTSAILSKFAIAGPREEARHNVGNRHACSLRDVVKDELKILLKGSQPGDYLAILAFLPDRPALRKKLEDLQKIIRDRYQVAVTLGIGPRYLHSTGQLHKGGPGTGRFLVIAASHSKDLKIPGENFSFATLEAAQASGDLEALRENGRVAAFLELKAPWAASLDRLLREVKTLL